MENPKNWICQGSEICPRYSNLFCCKTAEFPPSISQSTDFCFEVNNFSMSMAPKFFTVWKSWFNKFAKIAPGFGRCRRSNCFPRSYCLGFFQHGSKQQISSSRSPWKTNVDVSVHCISVEDFFLLDELWIKCFSTHVDTKSPQQHSATCSFFVVNEQNNGVATVRSVSINCSHLILSISILHPCRQRVRSNTAPLVRFSL